jgi:carbon-monoxide dehydrogenase large subunit
VTTLELPNNRLIPNAMEPRAANGSYSRPRRSYTLYVSNQNPHVERLLMCAFVLGLPEHKVRVIAPDVGGGFGSKIFLYAEEWRWSGPASSSTAASSGPAERSEAFLSDAHGRDHVSHAELAMDKDGKFLACGCTPRQPGRLPVDLRLQRAHHPVRHAAGRASTPRPRSMCEVDGGVHQHRAGGRLPRRRPARGHLPGRAHRRDLRRGTWASTRPRSAAQLHHASFPYATPVGLTYDTGDYDATLDQGQELADVAGFPARKAASEAKGLKRGIGYSCYIEACGIAPSNIAGALGRARRPVRGGEVRVHPTGSVTVFTGSHSHGQGHETTFAQVVAAAGHPGGRRRHRARRHRPRALRHGHLRQPLAQRGRHGHREGVDKIIAKGKKIAAHLMEASRHRHRVRQRRVQGRRHRQEGALRQVALTAYVPHNYPLDKLEPGLNENAFYDPTNFTYPAGTYICEVEVDPPPAHPGRALHRGGRLRQHHQPDDRRGPGARRHRRRASARRCWSTACTTPRAASC